VLFVPALTLVVLVGVVVVAGAGTITDRQSDFADWPFTVAPPFALARGT
jgi:hypothetical protein